MSSKVFWIIFDQIKIPKRKRNAQTFFQRELLLQGVSKKTEQT